MSSRKSSSSKSTGAATNAVDPVLCAAPPAPAPVPAPTPAPEPQAREEAPWPLLCPTPDCNEHLRAHPHPSAPVLFAACGHSHCGLCAAVVLREPLPQCPTCGVGVGAGQASPNTGLGQYGEAVLLPLSASVTHVSGAPSGAPGDAGHREQACVVCAAAGADEPATYVCEHVGCRKALCCDHSRFHAKKLGHTPVCLEGSPAGAAGMCECAVHVLPLSHYCMLHSELLCGCCLATKHLPCATAHVKTVQDAAAHFTPALSAAVTAFTESANGMLHAIPSIITAKADMGSRLQASLSRFSEGIDAVITAVHAHRSRVITAANLQCTEYTKALDSQAEVLSVSASQLQAAVAMAAGAMTSCNPVRILGAHATVISMAALVKPYDGPVVVPVVEVRCDSNQLLDKLCELVKIVTGCGLHVASVSGLVLQPASQQELRVVMSLQDGSAPSWLMDSDVQCTIQAVSVSGRPNNAPARDCNAEAAGDTSSDATGKAMSVDLAVSLARVLSHRVRPGGEVVVAYELLSSSIHEVGLQLSVCGGKLGPASGWRASRPQSSLSCLAEGTHDIVLMLPVVTGAKYGMAVSADEKWLVIGLYNACALSVYSLPDGELVRTFGRSGRGPLRFKSLFRLCFAPNGNFLVVDAGNFRLQEVTLEGVFVRFVGGGLEWYGYRWVPL